MNFIDTHTHLYLPEFNSDRDETVKRAKGAGIVKMLMPNIDIQSVGPLLSAEERYKGVCFPMMGLHPTSVKEDYLFQLDHIESLFNERNSKEEHMKSEEEIKPKLIENSSMQSKEMSKVLLRLKNKEKEEQIELAKGS